MKIYSLIILICLSISFSKSIPAPSSISGIRCEHSNNKFKCENQNELDVECDANSNLVGLGSTLFNVFGIGALPKEYNYSNIEKAFFYLYPRSLEESVYFNHSIRLNETSVNLTLFYSLVSNTNNYGIRVTDKVCFENLVQLLRQVNDVKTVQVKQSVIGDGKQVDLVGEVIIENHVQKRQWGYDNNYYYDRYRYGGYGYYGGWRGGYFGRRWGWGRPWY
ncbi:unnamed protein product [Brachionus calyciflorus]|uniref:Uncharacterized protein n=1 Tax=Brachionus calyciflorus TaxID=104777 RepID=A0A813X1R4_9BILA|nr:unnamed protein product [Brachionus calyciflorus]